MEKIKVEQFKKLYKQHYGIELPDDKATDAAESLLALLRKIYSPINKNDFESIEKSNYLKV